MMSQKLDKWQFIFDIYERREYRNYGWHSLWIGVIKLNSLPDDASPLKKENYTGVLVRFLFWFPVDRDY